MLDDNISNWPANNNNNSNIIATKKPWHTTTEYHRLCPAEEELVIQPGRQLVRPRRGAEHPEFIHFNADSQDVAPAKEELDKSSAKEPNSPLTAAAPGSVISMYLLYK